MKFFWYSVIRQNGEWNLFDIPWSDKTGNEICLIFRDPTKRGMKLVWYSVIRQSGEWNLFDIPWSDKTGNEICLIFRDPTKRGMKLLVMMRKIWVTSCFLMKQGMTLLGKWKVNSSCPLFRTDRSKHDKDNSICPLFRTDRSKQDLKVNSSCPLFRTNHLKQFEDWNERTRPNKTLGDWCNHVWIDIVYMLCMHESIIVWMYEWMWLVWLYNCTTV